MSQESHPVIPSRKRPEIELLLCCARTRLQPDTTKQVRRVLKEKIDWDYLIQTAFHHGVLPLVSWNLHNHWSENIPKTTLTQLKDTFRAIAQWNLYVTRELLKLLNLFQGSGIRALPFKGPALAAAAYGNPSLRHFSDLDILMSREDILKAKDILVSQGYHAKLDLTASEEAAYLQSHHDYKFVQATNGVAIDIQWGITRETFTFPLDFEAVWRCREQTFLAMVRIDTLALADSLLVLCVHGAKHRWEQLRWICDIAELTNTHQQQIDWERLIRNACTLGGERMLLLGLFLAHDLLDAVLPENILKRTCNDPQVKSLAHQVCEGLFSADSHPVRLLDERPFFYLQVRERWSDKVALVQQYFPEYFHRAVGRMRKRMHAYNYLRSSSLAVIPLGLFY